MIHNLGFIYIKTEVIPPALKSKALRKFVRLPLGIFPIFLCFFLYFIRRRWNGQRQYKALEPAPIVIPSLYS